MTSASATTFTVPPNSDVAFPIGTVIFLSSQGAGIVTVAPGTAVTIVSPLAQTGSRDLTGQYSEASLRKRASDTWVLVGDLA